MKNQFLTLVVIFIVIVFIGFDANAQCRADVNWTGAGGGASISGTTITKTGGTNGSWSAGAYDNTMAVGPGGYVQFQCGDNTKWKMIGLNSDYSSSHSYCQLDYAWYNHGSGNRAYIYENCGNPYQGLAYTTSDVFKIYWNPFNNKIEYYKNDVLTYTSLVTPSATLYVDCSIRDIGGSYNHVTVAGGDCQKCASPVVWTGLGGGSSADGATVTKTGGTQNSWSAGGYGSLPVGSGGFVQFQAGQTGTAKMIGLNSDPATNHNWNTIDYAWYPYNSLQVRQSGSGSLYSTSYSASDVLMIYWNPSNNKIEYYKNKTLLYTSSITPSGTYYVDISQYHINGSFTNVIVQGGGCSYTKDFF